MKIDNLNKSKKYLLTVSGGPDSMVMADMFLKQQINFIVAHCNFQLREIDADLDEELVKKWCAKNYIKCFVKKADTKQFMLDNSCSVQIAAREIRYQFFEDICQQENIEFIATAHHQDDNIETTLFHIFRGTGLQGLQGIPVENKKIIRPILHLSKKEILDYASNNNIEFRDDKSNFKEDYTRNKLRLNIIPQLEEMFPNFKGNIAQNIERMKETNEIYQFQIETYRKKLIEKRGADFYIPILKLKLTNPIQTILYELLKPFHFSFEQSLEVLKLIESQTGCLVENQTHKVIKNRNFFIVTEKSVNHSEILLIEKTNKAITTSDFEMKISTIQKEKFILNKNNSSCSIDANLLAFPLILRKWKQGDYLYPFGMTKKKKVSKVLIDAKIPLHEKEKIWVLESDKKIIWIVGLKTDNRFRITEKTKEVLVFEIK